MRQMVLAGQAISLRAIAHYSNCFLADAQLIGIPGSFGF
jgi:hypothetical protein